MGSLQISPNRNTSLVFIAGLAAGVCALGCTVSDPGNGDPAGGGSSAQVGGGGSGQSQSGSTSGGSNNQTAGTGSGTSGSSAMAGTGGGTSGGSGGSPGGAGVGGGGGSGGSVDPGSLEKFSFFVTSMAAMQKLSKSEKGFGGDFRYGTADGLTGADKICTEIAESSMPGASAKQWHAFLSTTKVNAKDRIGAGPWYDRTGRLVAQDLAGLLQNRPAADAAIKEDLPNETGTGNHRPNPNAPEDDNHHTLTGSNAMGELYGPKATCLDWTSTSMDNQATGRPRIGFSWSVSSRTNWISGQDEGGCGAGVTGIASENGGSDPANPIVGSGGGYGGIYCFALVP